MMQSLETVMVEFLESIYSPKKLAKVLTETSFTDDEKLLENLTCKALKFVEVWQVPIEPIPTREEIEKELRHLLDSEPEDSELLYKDHPYIAQLYYEMAVISAEHHEITDADLEELAEQLGITREEHQWLVHLQSFIVTAKTKEEAKEKAIQQLETGEEKAYIDSVEEDD